ncbi:MAG TPA: hypothetical protein VKB35_14880 [Ktedonobacteraceae bacterium]|nr:hypothetical protein [Ktedonobacteraceae bacterium]
MNPLQFEQLAKLRMEELQREATTTRFADSARAGSGKGAINRVPTRYFSYPVLWYLFLGLRMPISPAKQEVTPGWLQDRLYATNRVIGLAALGVGLLAGSYFSTRLGLFPVVSLGALLCAAVSLPIVIRSIILLKEHLLRQTD